MPANPDCSVQQGDCPLAPGESGPEPGADPAPPRERIRRLLRLLYREDLRIGAYRIYRRRAHHPHLRKLLSTFLQVEGRVIVRLEDHLADLGLGRPGRRGPVRRFLSGVGGLLGRMTAVGGEAGMLRRLRSEESRGAERYGREADWEGWSAAERDTVDGHRCDQLYQNQWAEDVSRDVERERPDPR
jgi:hypothetical protein